jgi:5-methylcytosine-specific restriction endonuclease McrA
MMCKTCTEDARTWLETCRNQKPERSDLEALPNGQKTHCPKGHPYDGENTYWYKGARQCRTCRAANNINSYYRHHAERRAYDKARWEADPDRYRAYSRKWQRENRERSNLLSRVKKQRRRRAGTLTVADWELVLEVYGPICLACGKSEVTIDHVVPVSRGGANDISNVQPLCNWCNTSKATKTIDYRPEPWDVVMARADAVA